MPYPYYPQYYPQQYAPQMQQQYQPMTAQQQPMQNAAQTPQIQNGGFISVRSEDEARNYPVAPGTSVTFIDEMRQKVYAKTMGFSQLDRPIFVSYKLVKEEAAQEPQIAEENSQTVDSPKYALASEYEAIKGQIDGILRDISILKKELKSEGGEDE